MKESYSYCKKYDKWCEKIQDFGIVINEETNCDLNCENCSYHKILWVEEDD